LTPSPVSLDNATARAARVEAPGNRTPGPPSRLNVFFTCVFVVSPATEFAKFGCDLASLFVSPGIREPGASASPGG
jgi:hypothetical protein